MRRAKSEPRPMIGAVRGSARENARCESEKQQLRHGPEKKKKTKIRIYNCAFVLRKITDFEGRDVN